MQAKSGFDYDIYDTHDYDDTPDAATFETELEKTSCTPRIRLSIQNNIYDDYIIEAPIISRDSEISSGYATITVSNADQTFNYYRVDRINRMGQEVRIGIYFPGIRGVLHVFTGKMEHIAYREGYCIIRAKDAMSEFLDIELGSGAEPITRYNGGLDYHPTWTPHELVWDILTYDDFGNLSKRENNTNPDINYASWSTWETQCLLKGYELQARFAGHTIRSALLEIAHITHSVIWLDAEGKFNFYMYDPPIVSGDEYFDDSNCIMIDSDLDKSTVRNQYTVWHGYNHETNEWEGSVEGTHTEGGLYREIYGYKRETTESRIVWHYDEDSASAFGTAQILLKKYPEERIMVQATMLAMLRDIADPIYVSTTLLDMSNRVFWITKFNSIDLHEGLVELEGTLAILT